MTHPRQICFLAGRSCGIDWDCVCSSSNNLFNDRKKVSLHKAELRKPILDLGRFGINSNGLHVSPALIFYLINAVKN